MKIEHFVQVFEQQGKGVLAGQPEKCKDLQAAELKAERAAAHAVGVVMFSVESDAAVDAFGDPVVLKRYGQVPDGYMS